MERRNPGPRKTTGNGVECPIDTLEVLEQYRSLAKTYNGWLRNGDRSAAVAFHLAAEIFARTLRREMGAGEQARFEETVLDTQSIFDKILFEAQAARLATQRKGRA